MNREALHILIRYATENIGSRPSSIQADIYDAIAAVLPGEDGIAAGRLAFALRETASLQLDFTKKLIGEIPFSNLNFSRPS